MEVLSILAHCYHVFQEWRNLTSLYLGCFSKLCLQLATWGMTNISLPHMARDTIVTDHLNIISDWDISKLGFISKVQVTLWGSNLSTEDSPTLIPQPWWALSTWFSLTLNAQNLLSFLCTFHRIWGKRWLEMPVSILVFSYIQIYVFYILPTFLNF